jgi:transcriptional regulator with XRE-family HTH domain
METDTARAAPGDLLREWRQRRRLSQLQLALEGRISTRHLSFIETGRARPSREMLLHLSRVLEIPLRERNRLLVRAGFAPMFPEKPLDAPEMHAARSAIETVLHGHEPYPALALDRHWNLVLANGPARRFIAGAAPRLLAPPVNMMRLCLHPDGLAAAIVNLAQVRARMLHRLERQVARDADAVLAALLAELSALPAPTPAPIAQEGLGEVILPLQLRTPVGELKLFSTLTVFGTALEVGLSELAIEAFFPADAASGEGLRAWATGGG